MSPRCGRVGSLDQDLCVMHCVTFFSALSAWATAAGRPTSASGRYGLPAVEPGRYLRAAPLLPSLRGTNLFWTQELYDQFLSSEDPPGLSTSFWLENTPSTFRGRLESIQRLQDDFVSPLNYELVH